jgi:hypothetical protein
MCAGPARLTETVGGLCQRRDMNDAADLLMLTGVARPCPDCRADRIFVPIDDDGDRDSGAYCCTTCGAATLIDPFLELATTATRVA